jgi:hypothetical protein
MHSGRHAPAPAAPPLGAVAGPCPCHVGVVAEDFPKQFFRVKGHRAAARHAAAAAERVATGMAHV